MAGIDKTYVNTWEDYKLIRDWAIAQGVVTDDFGNQFKPIDWFYYPDVTEEEFRQNQLRKWNQAKERFAEPDGKKYFQYYVDVYGENFIDDPTHFFELCIWNTSTAFDIYLIRYCPLEIIQNRLKQQYSHEFIQDVLNHTSEYDLFQKPYNKNPQFSIKWLDKHNFKDDRLWWWIEPKNISDYNYYDCDHNWHSEYECFIAPSGMMSSICDYFHGKMNKRKIYRLLRKWNLPKGTQLKFTGIYKHGVYKEFIVIVK